MKNFLFALLLCFAPIVVAAAPLKVVNVSAPAINCVFNTPCTISVNDTTDNIPMSTGGTGVLKSRTFKGLPGSTAEGLFAFEYLLDLRNAVSATAVSCIDSMTISFGPVVSTLDYNVDQKPDQVFVITSGGIGTIGVASAIQTRNNIKFHLADLLRRSIRQRQQQFLLGPGFKAAAQRCYRDASRNQRSHARRQGTLATIESANRTEEQLCASS